MGTLWFYGRVYVDILDSSPCGSSFFIKWAIQSGQSSVRSELNSLEILKKRYIRDEIGRDEYEKRKQDLLP